VVCWAPLCSKKHDSSLQTNNSKWLEESCNSTPLWIDQVLTQQVCDLINTTRPHHWHQSRRHGELIPPNWNMKHYKLVEFLLNLNAKLWRPVDGATCKQIITARWCPWATSHWKIVIHSPDITIVQPSSSRVNSVRDLYISIAAGCFPVSECPELPSFACTCPSSSRRCSQLQQMAPDKGPGRKAISPSQLNPPLKIVLNQRVRVELVNWESVIVVTTNERS